MTADGGKVRLTGSVRTWYERQQAETAAWAAPGVTQVDDSMVLDAVFGAGLSRALEGPAAETLAAAARRGLPIAAVDVPSGLRGETGEIQGAVAAVLTVTYFRKRPGHLLLPGRSVQRAAGAFPWHGEFNGLQERGSLISIK